MFEQEIYKDVSGYEGLYEVSNLGNVRSLNYNKTGQVRVLKPGKQGGGYLYVPLCKNNKVKNHYIHRLVAQAFIDNPDNLPEINHIDEDKTSNVVTNLEYCDHKRNCNYGTRNERVAEALSEKVVQLTLDYIFVKEWASAAECGRNGFAKSHVAECCRNEYCSQGNVYKGFRWMYAEDYYKLFVA